jgi:hypothetical protein
MNPLKGLILGISSMILLNSYIILLNERMYHNQDFPCYGEYEKDHSPVKYRDAVWLTMITFLTVGYGDFFPNTYAGRYIEILTAMCG